jgi:hypothetical protein
LVSKSVISFIGSHSVPPFRESMIAAAGAWPPPSSSVTERARAHKLDGPSPVLAAGETHADEINMCDLIPAASFQPAPAPASAQARRARWAAVRAGGRQRRGDGGRASSLLNATRGYRVRRRARVDLGPRDGSARGSARRCSGSAPTRCGRGAGARSVRALRPLARSPRAAPSRARSPDSWAPAQLRWRARVTHSPRGESARCSTRRGSCSAI